VNVPPDTAVDPMPERPPEPDAGACCQSGCDPCVYDLYWTALERYEQELATWKARRVAHINNS
jgi:hypothetical protein